MVSEKQALEFLKEKGQYAPILTVSLQRKFKIDYRTAANMMDQLVNSGHVSEYFPKKQVRYVIKTS